MADREAADIATQKLKGKTEYAKKQAEADQLTNISNQILKY